MLGLGANISGGSPVGIVGAAPPSDYFYESDFASDTFLFTGSDNTSEFLSSFQGVNNVIKLASTRNYSYAYLTSANTPLNGRYYKFEVTYYAESGSNVSSVQVSETGGNYSDIVESITYDEWVTHTSDAILFDNGDIGTLFIRAFHSSGGQIHISQLNIIDVTDQQPPVSLSPPPGGYYDGALDQSSLSYLGAAAAYSLRLVYSYYDGPAIRVRRASDNAEQDIGFSNGVLDTSTLSTFCSGTDGFVKVWYDQANGNDAVQATTANQPKIYDSANGVIEDGSAGNEKPAIDWNGSSHQLIASVTISAALASTSFVVANPDVVSGNRRIYNMHDGATGDERNSSFVNSQFNIFDGTNGILAGSPSAGEQYIITSRFVTGDGTIHANGTLQVTSAAIAQKAITTLSIGKQDVGAAFYFDGKIQAVILYPDDQSSNRTGIEANINDHYQIYWDGSETALFDTYSGASAGYSLRALSSSYTGPLVRVRRATDNAEQDIRALYNGELDTSALATFCAGTDGFVKVWYDQSGNGNDAVQATTSAQPKVYDSVTGVVIENSRPAAIFTSSQVIYKTLSTNHTGDTYFVGVFKKLNAAARQDISNDPWVRYNNDATIKTLENSFGDTGLSYVSGWHLFSLNVSGSNYLASENGLLGSVYSGGSISMSRYQMNANNAIYGGSTNAGTTVWHEYIIYNSDQSANRAGIESNINDHYNIYS